MATADSVKAKLQGLIAQSNAATGNTDADLTSAITALISGFGQGGGSGGGGATVTEYIVTENADRSLWLNEQGIKLVKGVNLLVSSKTSYTGTVTTCVQGAVAVIFILWDGVSGEANRSINTDNTKCHIRGFQVVQSNSSLFTAITPLQVGRTTKVTVSEDGLLTCTTLATDVITGNYNNSFIEGGYTYYLMQAPSEEVC